MAPYVVSLRKVFFLHDTRSPLNRAGTEKWMKVSVSGPIEGWDKCQWIVLDEPATDGVQWRRKVASGTKVADAIRSSVNTRGLQLKCTWVGYYMRHVLCLSFCMILKKWCEGRRRLWLRTWTAWDVCWVLGYKEMNTKIRGLTEWRRGWIKGLTKDISGGLAILKKWGMIGGLIQWITAWKKKGWMLDKRIVHNKGLWERGVRCGVSPRLNP